MTLLTPEPETSVAQVARVFGIEPQRIHRVSGGFSGAAVYQVFTAQAEVFAVRRTPKESSIPEDRLRLLHHLLHRIQATGINTIAVPREHSGSAWMAHDCDVAPPCGPAESRTTPISATTVQRDQYLWQAEPWLSGSPVTGTPTPSRLHAAVRALHEFHLAAAKCATLLPANEWFLTRIQRSPGLQRRLQIAQELSAGLVIHYRSTFQRDPDRQFRSLALRVCDALDRWLPWLLPRLERLSGQMFPLQPVIRDLWRPHVLFTGDSVSGLIDLTAMASDHVTLDLSRLLRSWYAADTIGVREGIEAYATLRLLNFHERLMLEALDGATVLLSPVTWLRRRAATQDKAAAPADVIERLTELTLAAENFLPL